MLERGLILIALASVVLAVALVTRAAGRRRAAAAEGHVLPDRVRERFVPGSPGVLYLYGPHCPTCRQQAGVLDALADSRGTPVVRVDATKERALSDALGVMTVPATAVVDGAGRVQSVNLGFQSREALVGQLDDLG